VVRKARIIVVEVRKALQASIIRRIDLPVKRDSSETLLEAVREPLEILLGVDARHIRIVGVSPRPDLKATLLAGLADLSPSGFVHLVEATGFPVIPNRLRVVG
jgi:hypothetical protein